MTARPEVLSSDSGRTVGVEMFKTILLAVVLATTGVLSSAVANENAHYDLLFKNGVLDAIDRSNALIYKREMDTPIQPELAERDSGTIALSFKDGDKPLAQLQLHQGDKSRGLGVFPASVGNPMILFFYETIVRDMASTAGGSPYYIRNRVKDALISKTTLVEGEDSFAGQAIATKTVSFRPFAEDPNADRMEGFGALELSVTVSDEVPGWYLRLTAEAIGEDGPVYRSVVEFQGLEGSK